MGAGLFIPTRRRAGARPQTTDHKTTDSQGLQGADGEMGAP